jgi:hypothetical protein
MGLSEQTRQVARDMEDEDALHDTPLREALKIIDGLLALAKKRGFAREAYSIVLGKKIPEPTKRPRGRPLLKNAEYRRALAGFLDIEARWRGGGGARARLARALADAEVAERKDSPARLRRVSQYQNDLSKLTPGETIEAAYYMRCIEAGESIETSKARLDAAMAGNTDAACKVFDSVRDLVPPASHINSKK